MSLYITAGCDLTVRRPLTPLELAAVRDAIVADAAGPFDMVASAVAAVFAVLSGETTDAEAGRDRYAIPISQWTAIAGAITDRRRLGRRCRGRDAARRSAPQLLRRP